MLAKWPVTPAWCARTTRNKGRNPPAMASVLSARRLETLLADREAVRQRGPCGAKSRSGHGCILGATHKSPSHVALTLGACGFFREDGPIREPRIERALLDAARQRLVAHALTHGMDDLAERIAIGGPGCDRGGALVWVDASMQPPRSPLFCLLVEPAEWFANFRPRPHLPFGRVLARERERIAKAYERVRWALRGRCIVCGKRPARARRPTCLGCAQGSADRNARRRTREADALLADV